MSDTNRWEGVNRPYTPEDVSRLSGSVKIEYTLAKTGAEKTPKVICGVVEGKKVSAEELKALADLPSKEVLISQLLATINGPTTNFVGALGGLLRKLVGTLDAIKEKKSSE